MIAGILLALCALVSWWLWFPRSLVLISAVLFALFGFFRLETRSDKVALFLHIAWGVLCILVIISSSLPIPRVAPITITTKAFVRILYNIVIAFSVVAALLIITASWKISIFVSSSVLFLLLLANYIVFALRGNELSIGDFTALQTALNVAGQYKFQPTFSFWFLCFTFVFSVFSYFALPRFPALRLAKRYVRLGSAVIAVLLAFIVNYATIVTPLNIWSNQGSQFNGFLLNFAVGIRKSRVEKPDGYSPEIVEQLRLAYADAGSSGNVSADGAPNIIIIMDEAFSDLRIFPNELNTNTPVTPFIDSLSENTVKGYALSSIFGGKTANSEFECLTGHTMAFFPSQAVPYQQHIKQDICSLPWILKSYGYTTFATHPFESTGWSRPAVYPKLGFQDYTFMEDYPQKNLVRTYVSDREMFDYVLDRLKNESGEAPSFITGITMQNHSDFLYTGENYTQTIHLEGYQGKYPQAEQYLSLLHETDKAVEHFLTQLQNYSEKTIVLFLGDHQPRIETAFYEALNGGAIDTLEEQMLQYTVSFFIWANYDIGSQTVPLTSLNYLPCYLLQYAGLEMPTYFRALSDIQNTIPAINAAGYYSQEKGQYLALDEAAGKEAEALQKYQMLQYNNIFDSKNRTKNCSPNIFVRSPGILGLYAQFDPLYAQS